LPYIISVDFNAFILHQKSILYFPVVPKQFVFVDDHVFKVSVVRVSANMGQSISLHFSLYSSVTLIYMFSINCKMHTLRSITPVKFRKIGATVCQILMLKCCKFDFCWSCSPDPVWGAYSTPLML